jgi:6-phosphogluconolactonase
LIEMQSFKLLSFAGADELAHAAASAWLDEIEAANRAGKTHCVALSGGRITQKLFGATVKQAGTRAVSFENIHFFWADERCVPPADPESNFKLANELLFLPLKIAAERIHRLRGEDLPDVAVKSAESELCRLVPPGKNSRPVLDLVLLGMGEDGHVASLFPNAGSEILNCSASFLVLENSPKPPPTRISLSYAAIAAARRVWVLVSGAGKADALRAALQPDGQTPLARVIHSRPDTKIFSDLPPHNL